MASETTLCSSCKNPVTSSRIDWSAALGSRQELCFPGEPIHCDRATIARLERELAEAKGRETALRDQRDDMAVNWPIHCRGVETLCEKCRGAGVYSYSSTATWRGGMGGQAFTMDACDRCWGTGDEHRHGVDLRALLAKLRDLEHKLDLATSPAG